MIHKVVVQLISCKHLFLFCIFYTLSIPTELSSRGHANTSLTRDQQVHLLGINEYWDLFEPNGVMIFAMYKKIDNNPSLIIFRFYYDIISLNGIIRKNYEYREDVNHYYVGQLINFLFALLCFGSLSQILFNIKFTATPSLPFLF